MTTPCPPRLAVLLVDNVTRGHSCRDEIIGDFHEQFLATAECHGSAAATRWYWREALRSTAPLVRMTLRPREIAGSIAIAGFAYEMILLLLQGATNLLMTLAPSMSTPAFRAFALVMMTVVAWIVTRIAGLLSRNRITTMGALLIVALIVGARHVRSAHPAEHPFRVAKVTLLLGTIAASTAIRPARSTVA